MTPSPRRLDPGIAAARLAHPSNPQSSLFSILSQLSDEVHRLTIKCTDSTVWFMYVARSERTRCSRRSPKVSLQQVIEDEIDGPSVVFYGPTSVLEHVSEIAYLEVDGVVMFKRE